MHKNLLRPLNSSNNKYLLDKSSNKKYKGKMSNLYRNSSDLKIDRERFNDRIEFKKS